MRKAAKYYSLKQWRDCIESKMKETAQAPAMDDATDWTAHSYEREVVDRALRIRKFPVP